MTKEFVQRILPGWERLTPQASPEHKGKTLRPRKPSYPPRPPTEYELLYHPFDLNQKNRIGQWIIIVEEEFPLEEILSPQSLSLIRLYLFPQPPDYHWLKKEEVIAQVFGDPRIKDFKERLQLALIRIIRRHRHGGRAIERLKLSDFVYKNLGTYIFPDQKMIKTIDEVKELSIDSLRQICGARPYFEELKNRMQLFFPDWNPKIHFHFEI